MTILITGGAGFIGCALASRLVHTQQSIALVDNFDPYYDPQIKHERLTQLDDQVPVIEADIRDTSKMANIFQQYAIHKVVNLAAMPGVRYSVDKFPLYMAVNTNAAGNLMALACAHEVELFVQASTSSVYGHTSTLPFHESDAADKPLAPYPASKRAAEIIAYSFHNLHQLNVTNLRFFNVYGPYGRPDMMPIRALEAIVNQTPMTLWNDGEIKRDWTYIEDVIDGIVAAIERPMGYQVINIGCGNPIALNDFIEIYETLIGVQAITETAPAPLTEPLITYCDNSRARDLLDFNPQTQLHEGLTQIWEWYRERL